MSFAEFSSLIKNREDAEELSKFIDQAYILFERERIESLHPDTVNRLYGKIRHMNEVLYDALKTDNYTAEVLISEIINYLKIEYCGELKEIRKDRGTALLHCRPGMEIMFHISKESVFIQGAHNSAKKRNEIKRKQGFTVSSVFAAINELIEELTKEQDGTTLPPIE